jgi:hypothetical protein
LRRIASRGLPASTVATRSLVLLLLGGAAGIGLVSTNPGPAEFEEFAAERLTRLVSDELCSERGMPMLMRLVIRDCPELVRSQRRVLGRLAVEHSRRRNFGLFSIYRTDLGGQRLLPDWSLPRYDAVTLAAAGRFLLLHADETAPTEPRP